MSSSSTIRLSNGELLFLIAMVASVFAVGSGMSYVAGGSQAAAGASVALAVAFIVGSIVFTVWRARTSVYVAADEGGVRINRAQGAEYVPFASLRSARLGKSFGRSVLQLDTDAGPRSLTLAEGHAADLPAAFTAAIDRARQSETAARSQSLLARGGQPLDAWLERLRAGASGDNYRERAVDLDELTRVVEDRAASAELRAAAIHTVIWSRDSERAARVMNVLGPNAPPLVTIAAALATIRGTYVAGFESALAYVSAADRTVAERMIEERPQLRIDAGADAVREDAEPVSESGADPARAARR